MIKNTVRWLRINFSSLRDPRYDYEQQTKICPHRVDMASAAIVHFGLDPGKLVRWLGGEYIGKRRDVVLILAAVKDHITEDDYAHMERIFIDGCPAELQFEEPTILGFREREPSCPNRKRLKEHETQIIQNKC